MACPMGYTARFQGGDSTLNEKEDNSQEGINKAVIDNSGVSYREYLQLDKLLSSQSMRSAVQGPPVHDEHLFIIIHQSYELWFKQIIFDIDHIRTLLNNRIVDETKTLQIVSLLERTVRILKLLVDQMLVLETMSPLDFVEFRKYLTSASGFQSLQFRLLENKLGVISEHRVKYNAQHYREVFHEEELERLVDSETTPSLFNLIEKWLERTPGIVEDEVEHISELLAVAPNGTATPDSGAGDIDEVDEELVLLPVERKRKGFWAQYLEAVEKYINDLKTESENPNLTDAERAQCIAEYHKTKQSFDTITNEREHQKFLDKRERRLSHNALKGALMIYFYRDMPRFSQPYQILTFLMDIDSLLQKWRYNHVMLVQRMLGSKQGSGGSSGYLYLRTTVSDRYKVFLDLFNLSTWLIPRVYIPKLSPKMFKTLSQHSNMNNHHYLNCSR
uniref:Tryptophan 2,3-dioxygenase n=1 Tax=Acrobeloides nanus TaxID=290746 RepID=A0A914C3J9_9BILA